MSISILPLRLVGPCLALQGQVSPSLSLPFPHQTVSECLASHRLKAVGLVRRGAMAFRLAFLSLGAAAMQCPGRGLRLGANWRPTPLISLAPACACVRAFEVLDRSQCQAGGFGAVGLLLSHRSGLSAWLHHTQDVAAWHPGQGMLIVLVALSPCLPCLPCWSFLTCLAVLPCLPLPFCLAHSLCCFAFSAFSECLFFFSCFSVFASLCPLSSRLCAPLATRGRDAFARMRLSPEAQTRGSMPPQRHGATRGRTGLEPEKGSEAIAPIRWGFNF